MNVDVQAMARRLQESLGTVIVGKAAEIELCIVGLLCRGHLLIEDVPGTGKTLLAKALARSSGCSFERVQFTPDLLPGDVTGVSVYNPQQQTFEFRRGPIFAQVLLADEINRATPKTQAALLEAMEERQVTVDGETKPLPHPFVVMATQNPIEYAGTFPLPEAQLDRFLLRVSLGYPPGAEEARMLAEQTAASGLPLDALVPVCGAAELVEAAAAARAVHVEEALHRYVVSLLHHTRADARLALGASPRAGVALVRASKSLALLRGRGFATADDVRSVAPAVLEHRLLPEPGAGPDVAASAIADALAGTPPP
jgi:MoxR-like ATPase